MMLKLIEASILSIRRREIQENPPEQSPKDPSPDPAETASPPHPHRARVIFCLISLYLIWGSTYLAIAIATRDYPPFTIIGIRHFIAGSLLFLWLKLRGEPTPTLKQWGAATLVGGLLLGPGNGGLAYVEQWVDTGLASLIIATTALWAAVFSGFWGHWPAGREWIGMGIGFVGVAILNLEGNLQANPWGALCLVLISMSWSFGSIWGRQLPLPPGMMSSAAQMLGGSGVLFLLGLINQERLTHFPTGMPLLALAYLIVFGSLVGFSSYVYLLSHVRTALATSYTYVNPIVAVLLGISLAGERLSWAGGVGMLVILSGVILVVVKGEENSQQS